MTQSQEARLAARRAQMQERTPVRQVLPLIVVVSRPGRYYVKQWCLWRER